MPTGTATQTGTPTPSPATTTTPTPTQTLQPTPGLNAVWKIVPNASPKGFHWLSPASVVQCKSAALAKVDRTDLVSAGTFANVEAKYGGFNQWLGQQSVRMSNLGWNTAGQYSYDAAANPAVFTLPTSPVIAYSGYAMFDNQPWHVKDGFYIPTPTGMICGTSIYNGNEADPYDPTLGTAYNVIFNQTLAPTNPMSAVKFWFSDEADYLFGVNSIATHADWGYVILNRSPVVKISTPLDGGAVSYCTATTGDCTSYIKLAFRDYLKTIYPTIAALNAAWGTSYTTFDTSDAGGLAGIQHGTYASWGTGTGFLDENGSHTVNSTQQAHCVGSTGNGPGVNDAWSTKPQIETDAHNFVAKAAAKYASLIRTAFVNNCGTPGHCVPLVIPLYNGPANVYTAMKPFVDGSDGGSVGGFWFTSGGTDLSSIQSQAQTIINAAPNTPFIFGNYTIANNDSPLSGSPCNSPVGCYTTQAARAAYIASWISGTAHMTDSGGSHDIVGFEHWSWWDSTSQAANFGFVTDTDNVYNLSAASTAVSGGICLGGHNYTAPAICLDPNSNFEYLTNSPCLSAASGTVWPSSSAANQEVLTTDGSCQWFNGSSYTPAPQAANYGNVMLPIRNALKALPSTTPCD